MKLNVITILIIAVFAYLIYTYFKGKNTQNQYTSDPNFNYTYIDDSGKQWAIPSTNYDDLVKIDPSIAY